MAVKTITIDIEAYNRLVEEKKGKESFSVVIKRITSKNRTGRRLLDNLSGIALSDDALQHTEGILKSRSQDLIQSPIIEEEQ